MRWTACLGVAVYMTAAAAFGQGFDPKALFSEPVPLPDSSGRPMTTGKAQGCPFAADFNGDGKMDIILGAKENMGTATGGIWLIPNRGTHEKPVFNWQDAVRARTTEGDVRIGCG